MAKVWKRPATFRNFGGHRYSFDAGFSTKSEANVQANKLRDRGLQVRIVHGTDALGHKGYVTYWRRP